MNISKKMIMSFIVALTSVVAMAQPYYHIMKEINGRLIEETKYGRPIFEMFVVRATPDGAVDWLTGLSGMARFHALSRMHASTLANAGQRIVAMAFDIMGMKSLNTRYGREEGDRLLCALANALRAEFGGEACSRFGEDHFYAFAPEKDVTQKVKNVFVRFASADFERVPPVRAGLYLCDEAGRHCCRWLRPCEDCP